MAARVRALRGATTLDRDDAEQVIGRTVELLREMIERNGLDRDDIISVLLSATADVRSVFPARAVSDAGLEGVPRMCTRELEVDGATPLCIRVMMHLYTERPAAALRHVYLHDARDLGNDLSQ